MAVLRKAGKVRLVLAVIAAMCAGLVAAYVYWWKAPPTLEPPSGPARPDGQFAGQPDANESSAGERVSLGRVLGTNNPAVPPVTMPVGRPPGRDEGPDLSTPAAAVYSVLSFIDQGATDELGACFIDEAQDTAGSLYPRYLGHPVELVDVVEDGESAAVVWNATVHRRFSMDGTERLAGETITLTTRLVRVEGLWKLLKLHERVENAP